MLLLLQPPLPLLLQPLFDYTVLLQYYYSITMFFYHCTATYSTTNHDRYCLLTLSNVQVDEGGVVRIKEGGSVKTARHEIWYSADSVTVSKTVEPGQEQVRRSSHSPSNA